MSIDAGAGEGAMSSTESTDQGGNGDPGTPSYEEVVRGLIVKQAELRGDPDEVAGPALPFEATQEVEGPSEAGTRFEAEAWSEPEPEGRPEPEAWSEPEPEARAEPEADEELEPGPYVELEPRPDEELEPEPMIVSEADPSEGFEILPALYLEPELEPAEGEPVRAWWKDNDPWWTSLGDQAPNAAESGPEALTVPDKAQGAPAEDVHEWAGVWTPATFGPAGNDEASEPPQASLAPDDTARFVVGIDRDEPHPDPLGSELWASRPRVVPPGEAVDFDRSERAASEPAARVDLSGESPTLDLTEPAARRHADPESPGTSAAADPEAAARIALLEERLAEALGEMRRLTETIDALAETLERRAEHRGS